MPAREYCLIQEEVSYGTPAAQVIGTNAFYARLHQDDTFTAQMNPVLLDIPYGGGRSTPALQVSDQYLVPFNFTTYLYAGAYSNMLLNWCMTPINTARTAPWTTTDANLVMPPGDLASLSFYHAIYWPDGTYDLRRHGGAKCLTWNIACSRAEPRATLSVTGVAIRDDLNGAGVVAYPTAVEFPPPTEAMYPNNPWLFSHTTGNLVLIDAGATARTLYSSVGIACTNAMDPRSFESKYMMLCRFCGRTSTLTFMPYLKPSPADLSFFQTKVQLISSLKFDNGTNSFKIDMLTTNYMKSLARHLAINKVYERTISVQNFWDVAGANDITLTTT
jgi:hypothetical protein